jgi:hypothetical protein
MKENEQCLMIKMNINAHISVTVKVKKTKFSEMVHD